MVKKNNFFTRIALVAMLLSVSAWSFGQTEIKTLDDLLNMNPDGNYKLMNDIDVSGADEYDFPLFSMSSFYGTFDGNGYAIKNLTLTDRSVGTDNAYGVGFFSALTDGATVKNLGLLNATVIGNYHTGGIAGWAEGATIENCFVLGGYFEGYDRTGSIVGLAGGPLSGEAVPENQTVIKNCYAIGDVQSTGQQSGGIVGASGWGGVDIQNCYFNGTLKGGRFQGAMLGLYDRKADGVVKNCLNLATTITGSIARRIIALNGAATVSCVNNYSIDSYVAPDGTADENGLDVSAADAKTAAFYTTTLGWSADVWDTSAGGYPTLKVQKSKVLALVAKSSYGLQSGDAIDLTTISAGNGVDISFASSNPAVLSIEGTTATAQTVTSIVDLNLVVSATGFASVEIPVKVAPDGVLSISNFAELQNVSVFPGAEYNLKSDIAITELDWLGLCSAEIPFTGIFNGNGHTISGMDVDMDAANYVGLFRYAQGAVIKGVVIDDFQVIAGSNIGALVGEAADSEISECAVKNSYVSAGDRAAAIAGRIDGTVIENCYAVGVETVGRNHQAGGIVGATVGAGDNAIFNCYYNGSSEDYDAITAGGFGASMLGLLDADALLEIEGCLNLAAMIQAGTPARISNWGAREGWAYFDNNYSISTTLLSGALPETIGLDTQNGEDVEAEDINEAFFKETLDWDFDKVWKMDNGLPVLQKEGGEVAINNPSVAQNVAVSVQNRTVVVTSEDAILGVSVYNLQGALVASGSNLYVGTAGVYVVKVTTAQGVAAVKVLVK